MKRNIKCFFMDEYELSIQIYNEACKGQGSDLSFNVNWIPEVICQMPITACHDPENQYSNHYI